jgi:hypothetical protein
MTQTIQSCSRISLSNADNDLVKNRKNEPKVNLSLLSELSEDLTKLNGRLIGLDYEMEKKIMELEVYLKRLGEIK